MAVSAFALAIVGRWPERVDFKRLSLQKYSQAVANVNSALADPQQVIKDEILATVMQLMVYERTNLPHVPRSALGHLKGVLSIVELRGVHTFETQASKQLLAVVRSHALMAYMSPLVDLEQDEHIWTDPPGHNPSDVSTKLIKKAAEIRFLRRLIKSASQISEADEVQLQAANKDIITLARRIDGALLDWPSALPSNWTPLPAESIPSSVLSAGIFKGMCSVYCNIWAANAWNRYRLARIAIHTIILDQVRRLPEWEWTPIIIRGSQEALQSETDALCSSVPFCPYFAYNPLLRHVTTS